MRPPTLGAKAAHTVVTLVQLVHRTITVNDVVNKIFYDFEKDTEMKFHKGKMQVF